MAHFKLESGEIADKNPNLEKKKKKIKAFLSLLCRHIQSGDVSLFSHIAIKHN